MNPTLVKVLRVILAVFIGLFLFFLGVFFGARLFPMVKEVIVEVDRDNNDTSNDETPNDNNSGDEVPDENVFARYTVACGDFYTQSYENDDYVNNDNQVLALDSMAQDLIIEAGFAGQTVRGLMKCETNAPESVISSQFYVYVSCLENCVVPVGYGVGFMDGGDFEQAYYQTEYVLPYGICNRVVELNSNPHITVECMGGDGGFGAKELVQFDLSSNSGVSMHYEEESVDM